VIQLCKVNQQNALLKINDLIQRFFVFYMFRTFYFHLQNILFYVHSFMVFFPCIYASRLTGWCICSSTTFNPLGSSVLINNIGYRISYYSELLGHKYQSSQSLGNDHLYVNLCPDSNKAYIGQTGWSFRRGIKTTEMRLKPTATRLIMPNIF
jgi:hypothetical protein